MVGFQLWGVGHVTLSALFPQAKSEFPESERGTFLFIEKSWEYVAQMPPLLSPVPTAMHSYQQICHGAVFEIVG